MKFFMGIRIHQLKTQSLNVKIDQDKQIFSSRHLRYNYMSFDWSGSVFQVNGLDLHLEVFDYDAGSDDDFMGRTYIPVAAVQQVKAKIEYKCTANHYLGLLCSPSYQAPKSSWSPKAPDPVLILLDLSWFLGHLWWSKTKSMKTAVKGFEN